MELTWNCFSVLINLGLLITAIVTAFLALKSLRQSRQIEINANRPMMMAEILPPENHKSDLYFQIANYGKSVAKNVEITFDPPLPTPDVDKLNKNTPPSTLYNQSLLERVNNMFKDKIYRTWVPGFKVSVSYWSPSTDFCPSKNLCESAEGVPIDQKVIINFDDELGNSYSDEFELNVRLVIGCDFKSN